jgi:hypothetical protein
MPTPNMNLTLPTVSVTLGPTWASQLNTAITTIDEHDHTSGKGKKVPASGLDINTDLSFDSNRAIDLLSVKMDSQNSTLTGASNASSVYSVNGDLYFTNNAGVAVQITSGGALASTPAAANSFEPILVNSNLTIGSGDTYVILDIDTTSSRTITLPAASSVVSGRLYVFKDITGSANANNIIVNAAGADLIDGSASLTLTSNFGATWLHSDGSSKWYII